MAGRMVAAPAEMLRLDLADAKIEPEDAQGRVVDFHGQRTTFISALARAGVSPARPKSWPVIATSTLPWERTRGSK